VSQTPALDDLEPRIKRMVALILANRASICEPAKGVLELHFSGRQVSAHLRGNLTLDGETGEPPGAA
jgi:hypothetical protein